MSASWAPFAIFGGFISILAYVTVLRIGSATKTIRGAGQTMDSSTRRIGALALVPGLAVAALSIDVGIDPPNGVGLGLLCGFGSFIALLGALAREGVLLERESAAAQRIAAGRPAPSSRRGQLVALILGSLIVALSMAPGVLARAA